MNRISVYILAIFLINLGFIAPVGATSYAYKQITAGDDNKIITDSDLDAFVWEDRGYMFSETSRGSAIFYFDGESTTRISENAGHGDAGGLLSNGKIAFLRNSTVISHRYEIYLYDIASGNISQVTNDGLAKGSLTFMNNRLAWYTSEDYPFSQTKTNIWVYDVNSQATTQLTNDPPSTNYVPVNLFPALTNDKVYWVKSRTSLYEHDFNTGLTSQITSGKAIETIVTDASSVAWLEYPGTTTSGLMNVYMYNGTAVTQITSTNSNTGVSINGNYVMWHDNVTFNGRILAYDITTGLTNVIAEGGGRLTTDGTRFFYYKNTSIIGSDYVQEPFVKVIETGVETKISFPLGRMSYGKMIIGPNILAWSGESGPLGGSRYQQVFIAQELDAPQNLTAATPTNQKPDLSWDSVATAASYNIYRNGSLAGNTVTPTYIDNGASDGAYDYQVTAVNSLGIESAKSNIVSVTYDSTLPGGSFTGNPSVIRLLGERITGTATDSFIGVQKVEIISGAAVLSSATGEIVLSCDATNNNCTWDADPASLSTGPQILTLQITDVTGNVYTTQAVYGIL